MRWHLIHSADTARTAPSPRFDAITWYCDGALWLFSGQGSIDSEARLRDLWRFDTTTRTWAPVQEKRDGQSAISPVGRLGAATWVNESLLYLYGGWTGSDLLDDSWSFDVRSSTWSREPFSKPDPGPRSGSIAWNDGRGRVWLFGGIGSDESGHGTVMGDLWSCCMQSSTWQLESVDDQHRKTLPPPLAHASTTMTAEQCWLFGGFPPFTHGNPSRDLWAFDKRSGKAIKYASTAGGDERHLPSERVACAMFPDAENRIYIFGGLSTGSTSAHLNDLRMFEPASRTWSVPNSGDDKAPSPSPRSNSCTWVGEHGQVWLFGGYGTTTDGDALGDLWVLTT